MSRFRVTVDQAAIAAEKPAIHIHDTETGERRNVKAACFPEGAVIVHGLTQQDGARVWIDASAVSSPCS